MWRPEVRVLEAVKGTGPWKWGSAACGAQARRIGAQPSEPPTRWPSVFSTRRAGGPGQSVHLSDRRQEARPRAPPARCCSAGPVVGVDQSAVEGTLLDQLEFEAHAVGEEPLAAAANRWVGVVDLVRRPPVARQSGSWEALGSTSHATQLSVVQRDVC